MVKKLLKHEAIYYSRTLIILEAVLFGLALFTRLILFFETDSIVYYILLGSSYTLFGLAALSCLLMTNVIGIYRFYKNLFTNEGYLSFTLPVSTNQHLFTKLFSVTVYNIIISISIFLAFLITISGDILNESIKAGVYLLKELAPYIEGKHIAHIVLYIIEFAVLLLLSLLSNFLLYYACIAIGQTAKKNRILLAVLCYFAYGAITEVIGTFFSIAMALFESYIPYDAIERFVEAHPFGFFHIIFLASIIFSAAFDAVLYFITHRIISRKLNLE